MRGSSELKESLRGLSFLLPGGGTFIRLIERGHNVSVAYQTSGSIAVSDEEALRFAEFADQYSQTVCKQPQKDSALKQLKLENLPMESLRGRKESIKASLEGKQPGQVRSQERRESMELCMFQSELLVIPWVHEQKDSKYLTMARNILMHMYM